MALNLSRQGNNVFADIGGIKRRITDYSGDISVIPEFQGGTTGGDMTLAQAEQRMAQDTAYQQAINAPQTYEQQFGSVAAKAAGQPYNPANIGTGFRPRGADESLTSYLQEKQAYELGQTGTTTINAGQPVANTPTSPQNAPQTIETPQVGAGQLLSGPSQLQGLSESDIARTSGANIYRRDLNKEQQALTLYTQSYGAPDFTNPESVKKFNEYVYEGKGVSTTPAPVPSGAITMSDLGTTPSVEYSQLTPMQQSVQKIIENTIKLTESLAGESAERAKLGGEYGLPEDLKTKTDLSNQLRILQAEAASIPLQVQEESRGLGITTTLAGRKTEALINQNAIKSLSVSALLQATNGNLATAMDLIDRATKAKFDPIREQIQIAKDNLALIIASPEYTRQEKAQAAAQQKIQDDKEKEKDKKEAEFNAIQKIAVNVAATGKASASALIAIKNAKTEIEAAQMAAPYLGEDKILSISDARALGVPYGTTEKEAAKMGKIPKSMIAPKRMTDDFSEPLSFDNL